MGVITRRRAVDSVGHITARNCSEKTIGHEHTGVLGREHNGVGERGLSLIQEGGMTACFELPRLFPGQLPDLDRFWVEAAIYMDDCTNTTATTANAGYKPPCEDYWETTAGQHSLDFMKPGFRRVHRTNKSKSKAERFFYLNKWKNHPRDCVKVPTSSGLTSDAESHLRGGVRAGHRGCAGHGNGRRTGGVGHRLAH